MKGLSIISTAFDWRPHVRYMSCCRPVLSFVILASATLPASADWAEGVDAFTRRDFTAAAAEFAAVAEANPTAHAAFFMLGRCQAELNESSKARESLQTAVTLDGDNWQYQIELGRTLMEEKDYGAASSVLNHIDFGAVPPDQRTPAVLYAAEAAVLSGHHGEALSLLQHRIETDASSAKLHRALGKVLHSSGDDAAAFDHLQQAYQLDPTLEEAARTAVRCALDQARLVDSDQLDPMWTLRASVLSGALATASATFENTRLAGDAAQAAGQLKAAITWYGKARKANPSDPGIAYDLGRCAAEANLDSEALEILTDALRHDPDPRLARSIHLQIARISARNLELDVAADHFRLAEQPERAEEIMAIATTFGDVLVEREKLRRTVAELRDMVVSLEKLNETEGAEKMQVRLTEYQQAIAAIDDNLGEVREALQKL